ncbi:metal dependent phosphohydrolase [Pyrolobus fumarii 1A]|uniref:Metal dependent phosphohydrolase n=1 Tax=Pyrolobus fumarii (strain DSM 11204 / 1A) TaxID=694429 RepID=G0EHH6_PYRF1|nr:metal dependent phosphohydrolase [Pyrolobus fumarii 1A]
MVSPELVKVKLRGDQLLERAWKIAMSDHELRALLRMSNVMAVKRLHYNDHGPVHATIVAGAALEIFDRLVEAGVEPTTLRDGTVDNLSEARLVVLLGALMHDIGNSVHRHNHELAGALLAAPILDRILEKLYGGLNEKTYQIRQEVMHAIYATAYDVQCLSVEAGAVKVGDGLDIAEGRARIPYKLGKIDIHAVSALSVKRVEISEGRERPISITIHTNDYAGLFQVEEVLLKKIATSSIGDYLEVYLGVGDEPPLRIHPS